MLMSCAAIAGIASLRKARITGMEANKSFSFFNASPFKKSPSNYDFIIV